MRTPAPHRRGNCLFQALLAVALLGLLLAIFGAVTMLTSGAGDAAKALEKQLKAMAETATSFEAPGKVSLELKSGAGMVGIVPNGEVDGKKIGAPGEAVTFKVTVTDADGKSVKFDEFGASRDPNAPIQPVGIFKVGSPGTYTIDVATSDGSPAAVFVSAGTQEEVDQLASSGIAILKGVGGGCVTFCGGAVFVVFGIISLVIKLRRKEPDPLEHV